MKIKRSELKQIAQNKLGDDSVESQNKILLMISTARCARLSYMNFDGNINYEKDIKLHDTLLESGHMSPFEHCARAMSDIEYDTKFFKQHSGIAEDGWCNNFRGWIQYRYLIENNKK